MPSLSWEPRGASCGAGCRNLAVPVNDYTSQSDAGASESPQGRRRVMLFRLSGPASLSSLALGRNCLLRKQEEKPDRESDLVSESRVVPGGRSHRRGGGVRKFDTRM